MAMPTSHIEPKGVRTPANSARLDMGVVRNCGVSQERNSNARIGIFFLHFGFDSPCEE
jgi:hypothetical protein